MAQNGRKLVRKTKPRQRAPMRVTRRHFYWKSLGFIALGTALLLVHLWQKQDIQYKLKEISHLNRKIVELRDENKRLQAKVTLLTSAGWIEKVARQNLGLRDPEHEPIVLTYSPVAEQKKSCTKNELLLKGKNDEKIAELLSK